MARDIVLTAGIKFNPKDIDVSAIKSVLVKTLANTVLNIKQVRFGPEARRLISDGFSKIPFSIGKAIFNGNAKSALKASFSTITFIVSKAKFGGRATTQLRDSFKNTQFTINKVGISSSAAQQINKTITQKPAAGGGVGGGTVGGNVAALSASQKFLEQSNALGLVLQNTTVADRALKNYRQTLVQAGGSAETFGAKIGQITTRFTAYLLALKGILALQNAFSASLRFIFEFDSALQNIQKVLRLVPEDLQGLSRSLFDVANNTGKSVEQVASSFNDFIRSGIGVEESLKRTQAALIGVNVTGLSVEESTKLITSALTIFKGELEDGVSAIDLLTIADEKAAASSAEISRAILRSGGAAKAVGVTFKELNAIVAGTIEATQLSGSTIGAALKTVFANIAGNEKALRDQANAFGANIQAGDSFFEIISKLAKIFPKLGTSQIAVINQLIAGKRRFTELSGLLSNFDKVNQIVEAQNTSTGVSFQRNATELKKLSTQVQLAQNSFSELVSELTGIGRGEEGIGSIRDTLKEVLSIGTDLGSVLTTIVRSTKEFSLGDVLKFFGLVNAEAKDLASQLVTADSIVKAIVKAGLFTVGLKILKGIVVGFKTFIGLGNTLTLTLNQSALAAQNISKAQSAQTSAVQNTVTAQNALNASQSQMLPVLNQSNQLIGRMQAQTVSLGKTLTNTVNKLNQVQAQIGAKLNKNIAAINQFAKNQAIKNQLAQIGGQIPSKTGGRVSSGALNKQAAQSIQKESSTAGTIAAGAVLVGAQAVGDALAKLAKEFDELPGFGARVAGAFSKASSSALEIGTSFGIMLGPVGGLIAGLTTLGISLVSFSLKFENASKRIRDSIEKTDSQVVKLADAQRAFGEQFGRAALKQISAMNDAGTATVSLSSALEAAFDIQAKAPDNLDRQARQLAIALEDVRATIQGAIRKSEVQKIINDANASLIKRNVELDFKIRTGDLGSEFGAISQNLAEAQSSLSQFFTDLNSTEDVFKGISSAVKATNEFLSGTSKETSIILQNNGLISDRLQAILSKENELAARAESSKKAFEQAADARIALGSTIDEQINKEKSIVTQLEQEGNNEELLVQRQQILLDLTRKRDDLNNAVNRSKESQAKIEEEILKLEQERTKIADEDLKTVVQIAQKFNEIVEESKLISKSIRAETASTQIQLGLLEESVKQRQAIAVAALNTSNIITAAALEERKITEANLEGINKVQELRGRQIAELQNQEIAAQKAGDKARSESLAKARQDLQDAARDELDVLTRKAKLEISAQLTDISLKNIQASEKALLDFRLNAIQETRRKEEDASKRRLDLIKQLSETAAGKDLLQKEFKPSDFSKRQFGFIGALVVDELENATQNAVQAMLDRIDQLRTGGVATFEELRKAQQRQADAQEEFNRATSSNASIRSVKKEQDELDKASQQVAQLQARGADAFELLRESQDSANKAVQLIEEETQQKRSLILEKLQKSADQVNESEQKLIDLRNTIPDLNSKVIDSENQVSEASASIISANNELRSAYQSLSDAQFRLNSEVKLAEFRAKQTTNAFNSTTSQISFLRSSFNELTSSIKASADTIVETRRNILQEELSLLQNQFSTVKSLAVEAATGGAERAQQISQQVSAAQQIAKGANISDFAPELVQGIDRLFGVVDGLERAVTEQGLASLGLPTDTLDTLGSSVVDLSKNIAETGKAQLNQQVAQVKAAQENVVKAEEQKAIAEQNLDVSRSAKDAAVKAVGFMAQNVSALRTGFRENVQISSRQLTLLEAGNEINKLAQEGIQSLKSIQSESLDQIKQLRQISENQLKSIGDLTSSTLKLTSIGNIGTAAGGSLSSGELLGLIRAANAEKRMMPGGSKLMMANTSEVVLNNKQAKRVGMRPIPKANAATGNANTADLTNAAQSITDAANALVSKLSDPGLVQQNINVQIDQQKRIDVRGLDGVESAVKSAFESRMRNTASKEEQDAISSVVQSIVQKLNENGLLNSSGF